MQLLEGAIREYAWGSHSGIARIQGRAVPTPQPEAELWLGAHPSAPSRLDGGAPLTDAIAADPVGVLGSRAVREYGERLPFLLKILAAAEPLSLQAHPDLAQARAGYAAESAAGAVPQARNYVDAWHKPELLVAVEPFDALCGFRGPQASAELLGALDVPGLKPIVEALGAADPAVALRESVHGLLTLPAERLPALIGEVASAAAGRIGEHPSYSLAVDLAKRYPADAGVLVAMLLNRITLQPDEAAWMPAGNLHAYLEGVGVEIMAASDNVLRGGLTPKHVDVAELLRILRFEVLDDPVVRPQPVAPGVVTWPVPVGDFALYRATVSDGASRGGAAVRLPGSGPRIVLCLDGSVAVDDGAGAVELRAGQAAFAPAAAGAIEVRAAAGGTAQVYQAGMGD